MEWEKRTERGFFGDGNWQYESAVAAVDFIHSIRLWFFSFMGAARDAVFIRNLCPAFDR